MTSPKISVIVPIYNSESYIFQCLKSICDQTISSIEILAIDDGSTDSSLEIIKKLAHTDKRIRFVSKKNGGYGTAVNLGLELAEGEFISIVESDDYISPKMFNFLYEKAKEHNADISRGSFVIIKDEQPASVRVTSGVNIQNTFHIEELPQFIVTPPAIWSAIYKRNLIEDHNIKLIETKNVAYQDVDFFVRTTLLAGKIICFAEPVYYYRIDNPNSSSSDMKKAKTIFGNYEITDQFIYSQIHTFSENIKIHYQKRKICDFKWHFRRLKPQLRTEFAVECGKRFGKIREKNVISILTKGQHQFYNFTQSHPKLYTFMFNLLNRKPNLKM